MRLTTRGLVAKLTAAILVTAVAAGAQPAGKTPKIGVLLPQSASLSAANITALRDGLRQLGYIEGQNIAIGYRFADGKLDRLPALSAELIRAGVQILLVGGTTPAQVAKKSTSAIPIVFAGVSDPVVAGLAASFARPAGNVRYWRDMRAASQPLRITLQSLEATSAETLDRALLVITRDHSDGLIVATDPLLFAHRTRIVDVANQRKLATVFGFKEFVKEGGLVSYGASLPDMYRRAATYIVEQPAKFELAVNLRTAKALGLTIPQSVLLRADEVVQ